MDLEFMLGIFCVCYISLLMYSKTASMPAEPVTQTEAEDHGDSAFTYWMLEEMEG